jgi:hypothetical protein
MVAIRSQIVVLGFDVLFLKNAVFSVIASPSIAGYGPAGRGFTVTALLGAVS